MGTVVRVSQWLLYEEQPAEGKTRLFYVLSRTQQRVLGEVKWFGRWRQYCFFPNPETVFNGDCLEDIRMFCEWATKEWKAKP